MYQRASRQLHALALALVVAGAGACATQTVPLDETPEKRLEQASAKRDVGMDHLAKGRTAMAIRELLHSEGMNPDDAETHLWLGEAYRRKAMFEKAEAHMLRALALRPDYQPTRLNLAGLYIQMERFEDAIEHSRSLADDPTFPTPWRALSNAGYAELRLGRHAEARQTLKKALDYHPNYWPAHLNMGILEGEQGRRLEAIERFEQVLELTEAPNAVAEVNYRLAESFVALGRRDRAIRHFSNAIDESPNGLWGQQSKRYLKLLR